MASSATSVSTTIVPPNALGYRYQIDMVVTEPLPIHNRVGCCVFIPNRNFRAEYALVPASNLPQRGLVIFDSGEARHHSFPPTSLRATQELQQLHNNHPTFPTKEEVKQLAQTLDEQAKEQIIVPLALIEQIDQIQKEKMYIQDERDRIIAISKDLFTA